MWDRILSGLMYGGGVLFVFFALATLSYVCSYMATLAYHYATRNFNQDEKDRLFHESEVERMKRAEDIHRLNNYSPKH